VFKKCSKCEEVKPVEEFYKDKSKKDGHQSKCKECIKEYYEKNKRKIAEYKVKHRTKNKGKIAEHNKMYREENKDKIATRRKQYREENREKLTKCKKKYYEENKEKVLEYQKQYGEENREKIAERGKEYREENKDKIATRRKQYREENKEVIAGRKKDYYEKNKTKIVEHQKQYLKTSTGMESKKKTASKRRGFGFSPINNYFEGSEFHHMHINFGGAEDHEIGIFIPAELHNSIYHNSSTWAGMDEMNNKAIEWYNENYNVVNYIDKCNSQRSLLDFYEGVD